MDNSKNMFNMWGCPFILLSLWLFTFTSSRVCEAVGIEALASLFQMKSAIFSLFIIAYLGLKYTFPNSIAGLDRVAELCLAKAIDTLIGQLKPNSRTEKKTLEAQITGYRLELAKISQVDEFAKYSKIQRKLRSVKDQLSSIKGQEREINFKYILGGQAFAWLVAVIFCFRIVYSLSASLINSLPTLVN